MVSVSSLSLQKKIGQLIFFGFDGPDMCEHARRAIREHNIGNVILFTRNFKDTQQLFRLIRELQCEALEANGIPLFIAADQEGGQVTRFTSGLTWFCGEMATRAAGPPALAEEVGAGIGAEMKRFGLNFNLAPVVDLANNPMSPHIGSRSYGDEPEAVAGYADAFINGLQKHVIATAKHFPSIGGSTVDLHLSLGCNRGTRAMLEEHELAPVAALARGGVKCIMTSHEIYTALDSEPGTISPYILQRLLRGFFGYRGLVISDCMEMKALAAYCGTPEGCVRAVLAGVDLLLVCHTESVQYASAEALMNAVQSGRIPEARLDESLGRIFREKERLQIREFMESKCPDIRNEELFRKNRALAADICERALTAFGVDGFFTPGQGERFLFLAPPPTAITQVDSAGKGFSAADKVKDAFPGAVCIEYPNALDSAEIEKLTTVMSADFSRIYVCTFNANLNSGQQELLKQALQSGRRIGVIALRNPFDLTLCTGAEAVLLTYEYTPTSIAALIRLFKGQIRPRGKLPISIETGGLPNG